MGCTNGSRAVRNKVVVVFEEQKVLEGHFPSKRLEEDNTDSFVAHWIGIGYGHRICKGADKRIGFE